MHTFALKHRMRNCELCLSSVVSTQTVVAQQGNSRKAWHQRDTMVSTSHRGCASPSLMFGLVTTLQTLLKSDISPISIHDLDLPGQIASWSVWSSSCCRVGSVQSAWSSTCFMVGSASYRSCTTSRNGKLVSSWSRSCSVRYVIHCLKSAYPKDSGASRP